MSLICGEQLPVYSAATSGSGTATASGTSIATLASTAGQGGALRLTNSHASTALTFGFSAGTCTVPLAAGASTFVLVPDLSKVFVLGNGVTFAWELYG